MLRNILAIVIGWLLGSAVNIGLIQVGHAVFPIAGIDPNDMNAYAELMPTLDFKYFMFPFLAHALGTFVGAFTAARIAAKHKMKSALAIGGLFLLGGIAVNYMLPGPAWFIFTDILIAYLPMAWFAGKIITKKH